MQGEQCSGLKYVMHDVQEGHLAESAIDPHTLPDDSRVHVLHRCLIYAL